jgi:hypothetical protein
MAEFGEVPTQTVAAPTPVRWKGATSFGPIHQLNERCIELLCDAAISGSPPVTLPIVTAHRELWVRLDLEARQCLARLPFVMTDAQFRDTSRWRRVTQIQAHETEVDAIPNGLPRGSSEELMLEVLMFAWQAARQDRTVALMAFAMSSSVAEIIAGLTPRQIRTIATRENHFVQIRWSSNLAFWRDLLIAALDGDEETLAVLHLHAKLMLCGELISHTTLTRSPL